MTRRRKAELLEARALSPSVRSLVFRTLDGSPVGHRAGQYLDAIVPTASGLPFRRSYSIASPPSAASPDRFELAVTRVAEGPASEALHALRPGDAIEVEGPFGTFVRDPADLARPALFVATGTGLAPVRAMLAEEVTAPSGPPLVVLFGCRRPQDVLWAEELDAWRAASARLAVHITLSRPPPEWTGRSGYVQRHVLELAATLPGVHSYVCGLSAMVDDVVALLARKGGLAREALHYETYD